MSPPTPSQERPTRRKILRDLLTFQIKLWIEGFKDVVLVPISIGATVIDLLFRRAVGDGSLYVVMRAGDRFERWIDLYGALDGLDGGAGTESSGSVRMNPTNTVDESNDGIRVVPSRRQSPD